MPVPLTVKLSVDLEKQLTAPKCPSFSFEDAGIVPDDDLSDCLLVICPKDKDGTFWVESGLFAYALTEEAGAGRNRALIIEGEDETEERAEKLLSQGVLLVADIREEGRKAALDALYPASEFVFRERQISMSMFRRILAWKRPRNAVQRAIIGEYKVGRPAGDLVALIAELTAGAEDGPTVAFVKKTRQAPELLARFLKSVCYGYLGKDEAAIASRSFGTERIRFQHLAMLMSHVDATNKGAEELDILEERLLQKLVTAYRCWEGAMPPITTESLRVMFSEQGDIDDVRWEQNLEAVLEAGRAAGMDLLFETAAMGVDDEVLVDEANRKEKIRLRREAHEKLPF